MVGKVLALACAGAAGLALALSGVAGGKSTVTILRGTVGPGFTINLTKDGRRVTRLTPGLYRIVVTDRSSIHSFKLEKSGGTFARVATSVAFKGTRTITVRLTPGRWEYYCQPHSSTMRGHFVVGAAVAATPSTSTEGGYGSGTGPGY